MTNEQTNLNSKSVKLSPLFEAGILQSFQNKSEQVDNHKIHYEIREGSEHPERTFVLSHGAFGTRHFMKVFAAELAEQYPTSRIIIVDLPWHGESEGPEEQLETIDVIGYTDIVRSFVEKLQEKSVIEGKFHWVGWSMGGSIGLLLDLKFAGIDELTLLNSSPVWETAEALIKNVAEMTDVAKAKQSFGFALASSLETHVTESEKEQILASYNAIASDSKIGSHDLQVIVPEYYDIRTRLPEIKAKSLIFGGTTDILSTIPNCELMHEKIPQSELKVYEDNHYMLVKPEIVKQMVADIKAYYR